MSIQTRACVHIFICVHKKENGNYCASANADEIFQYFKNGLAHRVSELDPNKKFKVKFALF